MKASVTAIRKEIRALADDEKAAHAQRFFKTGKGEYGEGDRFLGIRVPVIRRLVKQHKEASLPTLISILKSKWHEERLFAVLSLADRYKRGDEIQRRAVFDAYMGHLDYVNNWDLVDGSAHLIVGPHLQNRSRRRLYRLARSRILWERRIATMATYHFIRQREFDDALEIAAILLDDEHDLIHKSVGWMLREIGKRHWPTERRFLKKYYKTMPRTMLRYSIEHLPEKARKDYLAGRV